MDVMTGLLPYCDVFQNKWLLKKEKKQKLFISC